MYNAAQYAAHGKHAAKPDVHGRVTPPPGSYGNAAQSHGASLPQGKARAGTGGHTPSAEPAVARGTASNAPNMVRDRVCASRG